MCTLFKGILTDFPLKVLSKISKFEIFAPIIAFHQEVHFLKGIWQKMFPYEIRAFLA